MPKTTQLGNVGKWSALVAGLSVVVGQSLPETAPYANLATALAMVVGQWANGEGNVHSKTGSPAE